MVESLKIEGHIRSLGSDAFKKQMIADKKIPAILYGKSLSENVLLSLDAPSFSKIIVDPSAKCKIHVLSVGGKSYNVLIKDIVFHPLNDSVLHVDFMVVDGLKKVSLNVPIRILNKDICPGIKKGGAFRLISYSVKLSVSVADIFDKIDVDVSKLQLGEQIWLKDLTLPSSVSFFADKLIVKIGGKKETASESSVEPSK